MASFRVAASLAACLVLVAPPGARALVFSAFVERFEADGNVYGSADGVFDLVDEFDDGALAPHWAPILGTVLESGGRLALTSPGITVPLLGLPQEISAAESAVEVQNGEGSFTVTAYWDPTPLAENRQLFLQLYGITSAGPLTIESAGITVNHFDAATGVSVGAPAGWSVGRQRYFAAGSADPPVQDHVAIEPLGITGTILLRLAFDDVTDLLTASFSLDGGTTFQSPFAPIEAFTVLPGAKVLLGAAAVPRSTIPPCAEFTSLKTTFKRLNLPAGRQAVRATGDIYDPFALYDPVQYGVRVTADSGTGLQAAYEAPPGAVGTVPCGPNDGWRVSNGGRKYLYVNRSGVLPPDCTASANGLTNVKLRRDVVYSGIRFSWTARNTDVFATPSGEPRATFESPGPPGPYRTCAVQPIACRVQPQSAFCR